MVVATEHALAIQQLMASFKIGASRPLKTFQKMLGFMATLSPVIQLGLLCMWTLQYWLKPQVPPHAWHHECLRVRVSQACVTALAPWKDPQWMEWGVPLGIIYRSKVVSTDASNVGWGVLCDGKPALGLWSKKKGCLHINCLEMLAVCLGLCTFLPDLRGHHILIHSDSMTVVSYMNRQGCLSSKCLFILTERLLKWAQLNLRSLKAMLVPDRLNQGADMLSCSNIPSDEWTVHPQTVQEIFGRAEVYLFASDDNSYCQTYFSKESRPLRFSPDHSDPTGNQANQGTEAQSSVIFPALEEPALVRRAVSAALCTPLAHPPETGSPLSGEQNNLAPPVRAMGTTSLAS